MSITNFEAIRHLKCPGCEQVGSLKEILYGMPDPDIFDFEKFAVGGCCGSPGGINPDVRCRQCEWEGFRPRSPQDYALGKPLLWEAENT
jgi:hypothetical protein